MVTTWGKGTRVQHAGGREDAGFGQVEVVVVAR